ncbi:hypothetical protein H696_02395 [Fonticula alba]|uniref:Uncharacterized protein n=1 Tax=Fonticula alba TaxID=691883 RepID=A0A058ZC00_FONAL|nr:hypothetical protein H696_02395 [Fonticula alba]KCV71448.1 hypothetical protein H696_02395 [Fonticula alba]|eukprot:XP_009494571.1 hypothetical protein H696_02395 [Fonticula alba]
MFDNKSRLFMRPFTLQPRLSHRSTHWGRMTLHAEWTNTSASFTRYLPVVRGFPFLLPACAGILLGAVAAGLDFRLHLERAWDQSIDPGRFYKYKLLGWIGKREGLQKYELHDPDNVAALQTMTEAERELNRAMLSASSGAPKSLADSL